jgi:hypothetical protein
VKRPSTSIPEVEQNGIPAGGGVDVLVDVYERRWSLLLWLRPVPLAC